MTIIVADAVLGWMVSDTLCSNDDWQLWQADKMLRCKDGALAGAAGEGPDCWELLDWAKKGRKGKLDRKLIEKADLIVLERCRKIKIYSATHHADIVNTQFAAIGSGAPAALGALMAGAGPIAAVGIAMQLSVACGGEIKVERLRY